MNPRTGGARTTAVTIGVFVGLYLALACLVLAYLVKPGMSRAEAAAFPSDLLRFKHAGRPAAIRWNQVSYYYWRNGQVVVGLVNTVNGIIVDAGDSPRVARAIEGHFR